MSAIQLARGLFGVTGGSRLDVAAEKPVLHIKCPQRPEFRFEWHTRVRKVYVIRLADPTHGECMAHEIENHGAAINAVLIWNRGFKEAQALLVNKPAS